MAAGVTSSHKPGPSAVPYALAWPGGFGSSRLPPGPQRPTGMGSVSAETERRPEGPPSVSAPAHPSRALASIGDIAFLAGEPYAALPLKGDGGKGAIARFAGNRTT